MKNNYYEILGVTPDSEQAEIKSAYRSMARKFHPDVAPECLEKFKAINEAYETLSNEKKRMQYNMLFGFYKKGNSRDTLSNAKDEINVERDSVKSSQSKTDRQKKKEEARESKFTSGVASGVKRGSEKQEHSERIYNNTESQDITKNDKSFFEGLFSTTTKSEKSQVKKGADLTAEVVLTIVEAKNGVSKVVNILHSEQCPKCKGRKFINGARCVDCAGSGEKICQRKLTVKIPAGVKHEAKLRLKGEGDMGKHGGENGDLFIVVKIENNENMRFEGQKLFYDSFIEPWEAVLGTSISLTTVEGNILLKIPPKTKSGQKFRIQYSGANGVREVFVTVHIEIPSYLSDDEIRLYEKLKKLSSTSIRKGV